MRKPLYTAVSAAIFVLFLSRPASSAEAPYPDAGPRMEHAKGLASTRDYAGAAREFAKVIEEFPRSPLAPEAEFRMAEAYLDAGRCKDAEAEFKLFLSNFPDSALAHRAKARLAEARAARIMEGLPVVSAVDGQGPDAGEMRAVQVMNFASKDYAGVEEEIRVLRASGVNTIILRVFHNEGDRYYPMARHETGAVSGVYFKTGAAPVVDDVLGPVVDIGHRCGVKVFAWMTTRYADYGMKGADGRACKAYDLATGAFAPCKGLDLFDERNVRRLEAIYSDLAAYPIDGVLFQDDLVLRHNEGFGPSMDAAFRRETGKEARPGALYVRGADQGHAGYTPLFREWAAWKNKRLLDVAGRLRTAVRKKRPEARIAINLMYESVTDPANALVWLSQSLPQAVARGFDYYSIMAYHRQMADELGQSPERVAAMIDKMSADAIAEVGGKGKVLMKLQTVDWKTGEPLPQSEVVGLIRGLKRRGVSLAVVPYRPGFPFYELGAYAAVSAH
ncbi:MAG: tetratricopeptide repeat protein [Deltaproteobacteria bacterium]|nr:tetratricopeptide repeat protein [Deltaproteobacteria bacterium]